MFYLVYTMGKKKAISLLRSTLCLLFLACINQAVAESDFIMLPGLAASHSSLKYYGFTQKGGAVALLAKVAPDEENSIMSLWRIEVRRRISHDQDLALQPEMLNDVADSSSDDEWDEDETCSKFSDESIEHEDDTFKLSKGTFEALKDGSAYAAEVIADVAHEATEGRSTRYCSGIYYTLRGLLRN